MKESIEKDSKCVFMSYEQKFYKRLKTHLYSTQKTGTIGAFRPHFAFISYVILCVTGEFTMMDQTEQYHWNPRGR